jgi:D-methionine transport system permease protein
LKASSTRLVAFSSPFVLAISFFSDFARSEILSGDKSDDFPALQSAFIRDSMGECRITRSIPFIILLIVLIPVTVMITGTSLGVPGAIPPLVIASTPFFSRLVETSLREVDRGIIEAVQAMGATTAQFVFRVLLPEARPAILVAIAVTSIALVSEAAMSGAIGGGGLDDLAIRYGYQRFQPDVMVITVALLLVLVQALQLIGDRLVIHFSRR